MPKKIHIDQSDSKGSRGLSARFGDKGEELAYVPSQMHIEVEKYDLQIITHCLFRRRFTTVCSKTRRRKKTVHPVKTARSKSTSCKSQPHTATPSAPLSTPVSSSASSTSSRRVAVASSTPSASDSRSSSWTETRETIRTRCGT